MQYCIYLRKSRADIEAEAHTDEETLARHEKLLLELSKKMKLNVTEIYREVVSGESIAARPVVQQLLTEVENGMWGGVLVVEIERLARGDTMDQGLIAKTFKAANTKIITPLKTYDPQNEFDEEYFEFGLFMSRREYKTINRRLQRGRMASLKEGKYIASTPPYGYDKVQAPDNKGYTLKPNDKAFVIKTIFDLYTKGEQQDNGSFKRLGMMLICKKLDSLGIKPSINSKWSRTSIKDILSNPTYTGKVRWQWKKEIKTIEDGVLHKKRSKQKEYLVYDGLHEPIIDEEIFNLAKKIMEKKLNPSTNNKILQNPLSGLVYCGKCGQLMTRRGPNSKDKYSTLLCPNRYCDNISSPLYLVEEKIILGMIDWLKKYKITINQLSQDETINKSTMKKNALYQMKKDKEILDKQLANTYDLLEQGIYTNEVFLNRNKTISERIKQLESDMDNIKKSYENDIENEYVKATVIPTIENSIEAYQNLTDAYSKNLLLKDILKKVVYTKTQPNKKFQRDNANFDIIIYPFIPNKKD